MKLVQLLLTDDQADLSAAALRDAEIALKQIRSETTNEATHEEIDADIAQLGRLQLLFQDASENPLKYKPSPKLATIRSIVKAAKVPVPVSRRKRRASRAQRRKAERHEYRRNQAYIENYNRAVELHAKDEAEHQAALDEIEKRIEGQPTFTVTDGFGNPVMAGVPAEFIVDANGENLRARREFAKLILPGDPADGFA